MPATPDGAKIYINPNDAFNKDVTWSVLAFGDYQTAFIKETRVQMRLNAIAEAIEMSDYEAAHVLAQKEI